ncbi:putative cytochrome P450 49a1 [Crassostrea virginica]
MANIRSVFVRALRRQQYSVQAARVSSPEPDLKPFADIPGPTGRYSIPWIGAFFLFKSLGPGVYKEFEIRKFAEKLRESYGDIVKVRLKDRWHVFLFHPDTAKQVLEIQIPQPFRPPIDVLAVYNRKKKHCQSLATSNGEEWAALRKPTQELITKPAVVAEYVQILSEVANDFVKQYETGGLIEDMRSTLVNYATESVGMLCFNRRMGCLDNVSVIDIKLLDDLFECIHEDLNNTGIKFHLYFPTPLYRKLERAADHLFGICRVEINRALKRLEAAKQEGKLEEYLQAPNLLYSMLTHPKMTIDYVERSLMDLFVGGVESTSNTLTFLWFELAKNPEKQQKLYEEITSACGDDGVTKEALAKMSYLKACVREIMRLYRPTVVQFRRLENEAVIGGYRIPPQIDVVVDAEGIGMDPRFFKDPEKFLPERFVRGDTSLSAEYKNTNPFALLPFGFGVRSCVGQRFAETEIYVLTAKIFSRLEAVLPPDSSRTIDYVYRGFAVPTRPVQLLLKPRKSASP